MGYLTAFIILLCTLFYPKNCAISEPVPARVSLTLLAEYDASEAELLSSQAVVEVSINRIFKRS